LIDLHAHVLPGLDDGPDTLEGALELLRQAYEDGVRVIVASPHAGDGRYETHPSEIRGALDAVKARLEEDSLALTVLPGMELYLEGDVLKNREDDELLTVGGLGRYLCFELPTTSLPFFIEEILFRVNLRGYLPMIVHPERNVEIQRDPSVFRSLARHDAVAVISAGGIMGAYGRRAKKAATELLRMGLVRGICSDAHSARHRPAVLSEALRAVEAVVGSTEAARLAWDYPAEILKPLELSRGP